MQQADSLDGVSNSIRQSDNLLFIVILTFAVFGLLLWFLLNNRKSKLESEDQVFNIGGKPTGRDRQTRESSSLTSILSSERETRADDIRTGVLKPVSVNPRKPPEPSKPRYIGYTPLNVFEQSEPLSFPYVIVPKEGSVIKFPQKGRGSRKGYKEINFMVYLTRYFRESFQLFDDRFILVKGSSKHFEPDFTLIDERQGINIFLDIEIDEPYEGTNDILRRKATHYQQSDMNRNNAFKNRGWIVIRFAEIQVHQNPGGCCLFVGNVLATINPNYKINHDLKSLSRILSVKQWTKEEAELMSREKYREKYLGIERFGFVGEVEGGFVGETELGEETEEIVIDEPLILQEPIDRKQKVPSTTTDNTVRLAILNQQFLSFQYDSVRTIVNPLELSNGVFKAYCYIKNVERTFDMLRVKNLTVKEKPFTLQAKGPNIGLDRIRTIVNTAIMFDKFIRMKYTRSAWTTIDFDEKTGEMIADVIEAEENIRTIGQVRLAINALDKNQILNFNLNEDYITAFCYLRNDKRTFKFDRISEIAILDL